jgi:hypothetical protein
MPVPLAAGAELGIRTAPVEGPGDREAMAGGIAVCGRVRCAALGGAALAASPLRAALALCGPVAVGALRRRLAVDRSAALAAATGRHGRSTALAGRG